MPAGPTAREARRLRAPPLRSVSDSAGGVSAGVIVVPESRGGTDTTTRFVRNALHGEALSLSVPAALLTPGAIGSSEIVKTEAILDLSPRLKRAVMRDRIDPRPRALLEDRFREPRHIRPGVAMELLRRDTGNVVEGMRIPLNANDVNDVNYQRNAVPVAAARNVGVILMKLFSRGNVYLFEQTVNDRAGHRYRVIAVDAGGQTMPSTEAWMPAMA
jgi:hypothetical protein